jgi:phage shock protein E
MTPRPTAALIALAMTTSAFAGNTVKPTEIAQRIQDPQTAPYLLDVRTPEEFAEGHVPGAKNIPVAEIEGRAAEVPKDRPVVVYCRSGARVQRANAILRERGYTNLVEMEGSMLAWNAAQLPVEK